VILLCFYCITYIRRQYETEKKNAEDKSAAITEQNRMISSQNLDLKRLNAEKNKLMSIIAHDLRSPLGSIQNSLEIITEYDLDSEDKQFMEKELLQTTRETSAMLSKLLFWSKSQLTGISVVSTRHNLSKLMDQALDTARLSASHKKIELINDISLETDIYADADMMELIVRNLVGNAIKFTPPGGSIFISSEEKSQECWLCIRDTGRGIALEKQSEIFSLTAQSTYGTENEKGLGLGLLLCKEFINAQSGRIWFESKEGQGTSFYVSVPLYIDQNCDMPFESLKKAITENSDTDGKPFETLQRR
jgi:two-component system, sensor histidine kinase and response regulator